MSLAGGCSISLTTLANWQRCQIHGQNTLS